MVMIRIGGKSVEVSSLPSDEGPLPNCAELTLDLHTEKLTSLRHLRKSFIAF